MIIDMKNMNMKNMTVVMKNMNIKNMIVVLAFQKYKIERTYCSR